MVEIQVLLHREKIYTPVMQSVANKTWKPSAIWYGVRQDAVKIENFGPAVPAKVKQSALNAQSAIHKGTLHPFQGPIYKQDGSLAIAKGSQMNDQALAKMNFYVKGVEGSLPK